MGARGGADEQVRERASGASAIGKRTRGFSRSRGDTNGNFGKGILGNGMLGKGMGQE
ncbi:MAG: hypothetical protein JWM16_476 [Verrucomicrobiales bacterium]|nr:hypothetical protein [Verrucomicrobiales bacterium]